MMTVYNLAGGDVTKFESVFMQPWSYVYITRLINLKLHNFNKNLREIKSNKKP